MAKTKQDKKLYSKMRDNGVRKSVAKDLSKLPAHVSGGKQAPKPLRDAIDGLEGVVKELRGHADSGDRQTAARKAARTRKQNAASRSASSRKAARTRARSGTSSGSAKRTSGSAAKSRSGTAATKSRSTTKPRTAGSKSRSAASTAKSRSGAAASKPRARRSTARSSGSRGSS